ncbi:MAG: cytochrome c [Candidatus Marinimicrobia bacterium]|nr:cytochrome c [Candidatus Neomarinimicrobiota bacterium]
MIKSIKTTLGLATIIILSTMFITACSSQNPPLEKSGAQLWGENCVRCHNAPSPSAFSDNQWETVAMHMKIRANLNSSETAEIVEFLQMAN